jgi:hypothetical protein
MAITRALATVVATLPILCASPAYAQIASTKPYAALFLVRSLDLAEGPALAQPGPLTTELKAASTTSVARPSEVKGTPAGLQPALYGGLIALQALDAHSTLRAVDAGFVEQNPLMRWTVERPAALVAMKAAASAATIAVAEVIRKRHPKRAVAFMAAVNSAYAVIVLHNYRAAR